MNDSTLLKISLICSGIGILVLLFLSYFSIIPEKTYNDITSRDVETKVKVTGIITQVQEYNKSTLIKIRQNCTTTVNLLDTDQNLSSGENIVVEGKVQEYNGKLNILAEKITKTQK